MSESLAAGGLDNNLGPYDTPWPEQIWINPETGEEIHLPPSRDRYIYGDATLTISRYRDYIVDTIANNEMTVISSKTGTGKSTLIPQMIYEAELVKGTLYITQPFIVATRENTQWIRNQMEDASGRDMSDVIGYQTATEGDALPGSKIIQATDGLALQKMIEKGGIDNNDMLIIDEAHVKNVNITLLAGLAHKKHIRLVVMSATHDAEKTAQHGAAARGLTHVPVIEIPGTRYPIEERIGGMYSDVIAEYAQQGLNILAFIPGASETGMTIGRLYKRVPNGYTILRLNGDQTIEEQQKVFADYPGGVIVLSTNIGQMSITVPNMDVVVDCGWERMDEYQDEKASLKVMPISKATSIQRRGRIGRTSPGIYHLAQLEGYPPLPLDENGELITSRYDVPAIQRSDLSSSTIRLARAGLTLDSLDLEDKPRLKEIDDAHYKAVRFGAQALNSVELSRVGERMSNVPLNANYARMFVESYRFDKDVQRHVAVMLSACQYEGITMTERGMENWRSLTTENRSDMLVQLDVFTKCIGMELADPDTFATKLNKYNIIEQRYLKAKKIYQRLCEDLGLDAETPPQSANEQQRQQIIGCIVAGSNKLFVSKSYGIYADQTGFEGRFTRSTTIDSNPHLVVGTAFRLEHMRNGIIKGHNLVKDATIVTPAMLEKYAPWRCSYANDQPVLTVTGKVMTNRDLYFDGRPTRTASAIEAEPNQESLEILVNKLFNDRDRVEKASRQTTALYEEIERIRNLLVDYSDNAMQFEHTMNSFKEIITSWKDIKANDINLLAKTLTRRSVLTWLKNTIPEDSYQAIEILDGAPVTALYEVEGEAYEIPVAYRNNAVFISVDAKHARFLAGIEDQFGGRDIYVKAASSRYIPLKEAVVAHTGFNRALRRKTS